MAGPLDLLMLLIAGVLVMIFVIKHDDSEIDFWQERAFVWKERYMESEGRYEDLCEELERYKVFEGKYTKLTEEYNYANNGYAAFPDTDLDNCEIRLES